jgi:phosphate uptake regulator
MKRKVNRVGTATLTISLPAKWAKQQEITPGDELEVEEQGGSLRITRQSRKEVKRIAIRLHDENEDDLRSIFGALYRAGYDEIEVTSDSYQPLLELQEAVTMLQGYEYFETSKTKAVVKNIVSSITMDLPECVSKMRHNINTIHSVLMDSIRSGAFDKYADIKMLRKNVLKYRDIVSRNVLQEGVIDNTIFPYIRIAENISHVAGYYRTFYNCFTKQPMKPSKDAIAFLDSINTYFNDMFIRKSSSVELHQRVRRLEPEAFALIKKRPADTFVVTMALCISRPTQSMNSCFNILEICKKEPAENVGK